MFIKAEDCPACWLKQSITTCEAFTLQALGAGRAARYVEGKKADNATSHQVIAGKARSVHLKNMWEECCDAGPWKKP